MQIEMTSSKAVKEAKRLQKVIEAKGGKTTFAAVCEGLAQARGFQSWSAYLGCLDKKESPPPCKGELEPASIQPPAFSTEEKEFNLTAFFPVKVRINGICAQSQSEAVDRALNDSRLMRQVMQLLDIKGDGDRIGFAELADDEDPVTVLVDEAGDTEYELSQWHKRQPDGTITLDAAIHTPGAGDLVYVGAPRYRDRHSRSFIGTLAKIDGKKAEVADGKGTRFETDSDNVWQLEYVLQSRKTGDRSSQCAYRSIDAADVAGLLDDLASMSTKGVKLLRWHGSHDLEVTAVSNDDYDPNESPDRYVLAISSFDDGVPDSTDFCSAAEFSSRYGLEGWSVPRNEQ